MSVNFAINNSTGLTLFRLTHMLLNCAPLLGSGAYAFPDDRTNQNCVRVFSGIQQIGAVHFTNHKRRKVGEKWIETVEGVVSDSTPDELMSAAATTMSYNMPDVFKLR